MTSSWTSTCGSEEAEALTEAGAVQASATPGTVPVAAHAEGARPTPPAKGMPGKSLFEHFSVRRRFSLF